MFLLIDSSKFRKTSIMTAGLVKAEGDKTLYCWCCWQLGHAKFFFLQSKSKPIPRIIQSKSQLFMLTIQQRRLVTFTKVVEMFPLWAEQSRSGKLLRSPSKKTPSFQKEKTVRGKVWRLSEEQDFDVIWPNFGITNSTRS